MPFDVKETTLPGVGKKYEIYLDENRSVAVVINRSGGRQVYYREDPSEDYERQFELTDAQARTVGLFLVGAYYQPVAAKLAEETAAGEHIEWYSVTEDSPIAGKRGNEVALEEKTGATVLGIERDREVSSVLAEDIVFEVGDRLIVIGTDEAHKELNSLLTSI